MSARKMRYAVREGDLFDPRALQKITGGISQASRVVARSNNNANANGGVAYANANNAASNANTNYGSRLANIKKIKV